MTAHIIQMRFPTEPAPPPDPYAMRVELAVLKVAERVARGSTLTAAQHMSIWLDHHSFVPLTSIRAEFERIV